MSKRSVHKLNQRVREGTEGKRRVQLHVMRTHTQRIADLVADQLQDLIAEEVANELDRRGYQDREDSESPDEVPQESGAQIDTETPRSVGETCPRCCQKKLRRHIDFPLTLFCTNCMLQPPEKVE